MSDLVLQAENISKYYDLGVIDSTSFKKEVIKFINQSILRKEIEADDPDLRGIWALRDVSFDVKEGEIIGFVGKNGSGKSTLLKILSRISIPTKGCIRGRGRIASLLEVGTGFHGELTGRENIYLNGQILGLSRREIAERFDSIVDFSGVERFLDTPVKRYSSGMYVRLAFSVAAHLKSEIMIIDEVLAVGDAEFQIKCLAKIREIAKGGRTVLFVSHHMQMLRNLCDRAIYLEKGRIISSGTPDEVITDYFKREQLQFLLDEHATPEGAPGNELIRIKRAELVPRYESEKKILVSTPLSVNFEFWFLGQTETPIAVSVLLFTFEGECIFDLKSAPCTVRPGLIKGGCGIPGNFLNDGSYYITIAFIDNNNNLIWEYYWCLCFDMEDDKKMQNWYGKWMGHVRPDFPVVLRQSE